jgi:large subunit ribosomal protein L6
MSRIGRQPISIPDKVKVDIKDSHVAVSGPKGTLEMLLRPEVVVEKEDKILKVTTRDSSRRTIAFSGLTRSLINNMVVGVDKGFQRKLIIEGVGYRAEVAGTVLTLNVGYSNPVKFDLPKGVSAVVEKTTITLEAIDKELLGLTAARIRAIRKPEPYKGKGIRYEGEHIVRKAGKTAGK